jgi:hypothetical protein
MILLKYVVERFPLVRIELGSNLTPHLGSEHGQIGDDLTTLLGHRAHPGLIVAILPDQIA